jgi:hypothetical protein
VLPAVEGDALDQPGDFLGFRLALRDGGVSHVGTIFPRMAKDSRNCCRQRELRVLALNLPATHQTHVVATMEHSALFNGGVQRLNPQLRFGIGAAARTGAAENADSFHKATPNVVSDGCLLFRGDLCSSGLTEPSMEFLRNMYEADLYAVFFNDHARGYSRFCPNCITKRRADDALSVDSIISQAGLNQNRVAELRKQFICKEHIHIATRKPGGKLVREETADYESVPTSTGPQQ